MQLDLFEDDPTPEGNTELIECPTCKESKPISEYYTTIILSGALNMSGARRKCKPCYRKNMKLTYQLKKDNPYPHKNPTCECCGTKSDKEVLNLDHCHDGETFRGWLCRSCNIGIGALGDNIEGLEKAMAYLRSKDE
jgi:hypothetical protein